MPVFSLKGGIKKLVWRNKAGKHIPKQKHFDGVSFILRDFFSSYSKLFLDARILTKTARMFIQRRNLFQFYHHYRIKKRGKVLIEKEPIDTK